jgi:hypothetical protein
MINDERFNRTKKKPSFPPFLHSPDYKIVKADPNVESDDAPCPRSLRLRVGRTGLAERRVKAFIRCACVDGEHREDDQNRGRNRKVATWVVRNSIRAFSRGRIVYLHVRSIDPGVRRLNQPIASIIWASAFAALL